MPKRNIKAVNQTEVTPRDSNQQYKERSVSLIVTRNCNLRCTYCYEKHDLREGDAMEPEVARSAISHYLESDDDFKRVGIDFFGGEPLLAFDLIKDTVEWVNARKWPKDYRFVIGTNGTLLNDEMKNWMYRNRYCLNLAVSLDGNKVAHDLTRDNSYNRVQPHLSFFKNTGLIKPLK